MDEINAQVEKPIATTTPLIKTEDVFGLLRQDVPSEVRSQLPVAQGSVADKIAQANQASKDLMVDAYAKVINQQMELQRPLSIGVIILFGLQLLALNAVILVLIYICHDDIQELTLLFDFLKYYIGAVVVELLGLVTIIVKSTFSSKLPQIVENIFGSKKGANK